MHTCRCSTTENISIPVIVACSCTSLLSCAGFEIHFCRMELLKDEFVSILWGPPSAEFLRFKDSTQKIFQERQQHPDENVTAIAPHYKITDGCVFTPACLRGYYEWKDFVVRQDDVVVTSFPKTGTTWLQEIVYHVLHYEDINKPDLISIDDRFPFMEFPSSNDVVKAFKDLPSPRLIKSHLPLSLLPLGECNRSYKIIYICRNPKDTVVSYYHFYKAMVQFEFAGSLQDFVKMFVNDMVLYAPYWKHLLEFWQHRNDSNVLFLKYEDLQKDLADGVRKVSDFLGKQLTEEQIIKIVHRCSFDEMSSNPSSNHCQWEGNLSNPQISKFMRKGQVGNWKCFLDSEMNRQLDSWIETHLNQTDLIFDYE